MCQRAFLRKQPAVTTSQERRGSVILRTWNDFARSKTSHIASENGWGHLKHEGRRVVHQAVSVIRDEQRYTRQQHLRRPWRRTQ
jgi:hypothetical protein